MKTFFLQSYKYCGRFFPDMKTITRFICEHCNKEYENEVEARFCELTKNNPKLIEAAKILKKLPRHLKFESMLQIRSYFENFGRTIEEEKALEELEAEIN